VGDVHKLLESIGFEPFVVLGGDDFAEMVKNGGELVTDDYAHFDPYAVLRSAATSEHVKVRIPGHGDQ
jgi:hypothetical protein